MMNKHPEGGQKKPTNSERNPAVIAETLKTTKLEERVKAKTKRYDEKAGRLLGAPVYF